MRQTALVLKTFPDDTAEISVQRRSACGGNCSGCRGCDLSRNVITATADNAAGARVGQMVTVETRTRLIFRYAVIVYIIPVLLLVMGYAAGMMLGLSEGLCILIGFGLLLAGTAIIVAYYRKNKDNTLSYTISSVLEEH